MAYFRFRTVFRLLKETFGEWQKDRAAQLAAALAYYTVFSLTPLLVITIAIAGSIVGETAARQEIIGRLQFVLNNTGTDVIETILNNVSQPEIKGLASLISIIVLLIGASGVFAQLQDAFNQIWKVGDNQPQGGIKELVKKRLLSFVMVFFIGVLLLVSLILSAVLSALTNISYDFLPRLEDFWRIVNYLLSFTIIAFLFAVLYKYVPDVPVAWKDVRVGSILSTLLFIIGKEILGIYLGRSSFSSAYGAAGSLIVLLAWIYYSAQILLFGAEFTQVYAKRYGSKRQLLRENEELVMDNR
ncbi:ribonuclease BN [Gloeothece citriformis PCC 7424]|uniref:Ribonuclease BN n=1 Tax=Gloeothece citriformis (strain PCC 7424) TaxID=65393 RepID=B7KDS6_GLOC7|nr:YihY/virulence factor BrkB family protein [Gloeothece citriformis]ACK70378.1 ribonuclease BN [Gloeothece citriformis PCC 7424]